MTHHMLCIHDNYYVMYTMYCIMHFLHLKEHSRPMSTCSCIVHNNTIQQLVEICWNLLTADETTDLTVILFMKHAAFPAELVSQGGCLQQP